VPLGRLLCLSYHTLSEMEDGTKVEEMWKYGVMSGLGNVEKWLTFQRPKNIYFCDGRYGHTPGKHKHQLDSNRRQLSTRFMTNYVHT
jgi:hypothetical protein